DASKLTLVSTAVNGDYTAKVEADGTVTFGYVAMNGIPAGEAVATLTFTTESGNSNVIVEQKQVNNETGATETLLVELEHANTEIRDAREATCTEDGYTGDTYCTDCGELIAKGEVIPATGHSYGEWTVTKAATCFAEGEEVRTCACGEVETRVIEKRTDCPSDAFSDLDKTQWYHEGVDFVLDNGLMKGMSDTVFVPNGEVTRAQLVTILYRLEGQPSVEGLENPFKDVTENAWYAEAVIWAVNNGVVNGTSETTFDPNAAITREQIAAILFRYAGAEAVEEDHLKDFTDANQISAYAVDAMNWAVSEGLITGMGDGTVAPRATATRAQIATILMRYCN
ncbi:MAG: S-layer homology domain-containing protein, partial [Oscillospiraceae bacterium]|nr:S-layer homology domain-containing protein [Oscillospiraceae bacterium]